MAHPRGHLGIQDGQGSIHCDWAVVDDIVSKLAGGTASPMSDGETAALLESLQRCLAGVRRRQERPARTEESLREKASRAEALRSELLRTKQDGQELRSVNEMLQADVRGHRRMLDEALHRQGWLQWELEKTMSGQLAPATICYPGSADSGTSGDAASSRSV
eukprot:gnl/TRDRNA2_/TRDRNA2_191649_c0_seq1.p1 gnl/TRDRNA2_/TRDRNA2_191649_c0~~gnl/TRDRNA2_/TRDRNA2_191649_c0_seq1.p1  ORF type:complete len:186 (-),score=21.02 gnl/TRDRNA2_/TRDRNA2_191649_c0_seq1:160-645(-)